jgi:hypothetical protein
MSGIRSFGFQGKARAAPLKICRCSAIDPTTVSRTEPSRHLADYFDGAK